jgi:hypothetical protein
MGFLMGKKGHCGLVGKNVIKVTAKKPIGNTRCVGWPIDGFHKGTTTEMDVAEYPTNPHDKI